MDTEIWWTWEDLHHDIYNNACAEIGRRLQCDYKKDPAVFRRMVEYISLFVLVNRIEDDASSVVGLENESIDSYIRYHPNS